MRLKRIIPVILCFVIIIGCIPVHASSSGVSNFLITEFWGAVKDSLVDFPGQVEGMKAANEDPCAASPNGHHNFTKSEVPGLKGSLCGYCGADFFSFCDDAYDSYVEDLQTDLGTSVLTGDGFRIYFTPFACPTSSYVTVQSESFLNGVYSAFLKADAGSSPYVVDVILKTFVAPVDGYYTAGFSYRTDMTADSDRQYLVEYSGRTYVHSKGEVIFFSDQSLNMYNANRFLIQPESFANIVLSAWMDVVPVSGTIPTTQNITINSRPSSITGDYGIIGDDGTIIKVDGDMIVDESSNTIYNPVTNTTISFTDYTYDYSDRSYNLTLEDGSTMKVIYGDENITINEGDTIYNIYYLVEDDSGGGSGDGGDGSGDKHTHDYTSEITKQPSCLISGVRTFTCSCGDSYTKTISATGHDWVISQQVPTTYDPETGEQTQAGYTVYVCGSCAEQYKSTDGSAPPNGSSGGDDSSGGFGDIIVGLFSVIGDIIGGLLEGALVLATKALEALTGLGSLFTQMVETILGFFGGFLDFLSAMFPFLPEETITILNFGLILMIAAAVFNKFFK